MTNAERLARCKAEVEARLKVCERIARPPWFAPLGSKWAGGEREPGMQITTGTRKERAAALGGRNDNCNGQKVCFVQEHVFDGYARRCTRDFILASGNQRPGELRIIEAMLATVERDLLSDVGPFESGDQCWYTGKNWGDPLDWCGCAAFPVEESATEDPSGNEGYLVHWASPNYQAPQRTWAKRSELALRTNGAIPDAADRALHNNATALLDSIYSGLFGEAK